MKIPQKIVAAAAALWLAGAAHAADLPTFKLEMTDGKLNPARIEVPAGQRFKIEIKRAFPVQKRILCQNHAAYPLAFHLFEDKLFVFWL